VILGVGPGAVATPINLSTMKDPALMQKLHAAIPLGRMAQPEGKTDDPVAFELDTTRPTREAQGRGEQEHQ
jgi:NAD(P)-dependent dehydrogenase (short-subunit alcohol dehydrogenase family)